MCDSGEPRDPGASAHRISSRHSMYRASIAQRKTLQRHASTTVCNIVRAVDPAEAEATGTMAGSVSHTILAVTMPPVLGLHDLCGKRPLQGDRRETCRPCVGRGCEDGSDYGRGGS
jgi:hypothetical protein